MIRIIVIVVGLLSIYWFLKLIKENRCFKNKFDISVLSNETIKILGGFLTVFLFCECFIILQGWHEPIDNIQLLYYDLMLISNLALIAKYKKILNGLERLTEIKK